VYALMKVSFSYTAVLCRTVSTTCDVFDITTCMNLVMQTTWLFEEGLRTPNT